jgi:hypothetical protein
MILPNEKGLEARNSKAPVLDVTCISYILSEGLQSTVYCDGRVSSYGIYVIRTNKMHTFYIKVLI